MKKVFCIVVLAAVLLAGADIASASEQATRAIEKPQTIMVVVAPGTVPVIIVLGPPPEEWPYGVPERSYKLEFYYDGSWDPYVNWFGWARH